MPEETPEILNVYADADYASQYAGLDWRGTYYLVRRDLPTILARHATPGRALDFGCGTGRSTRLLGELGFDAIGVDVSEAMVEIARKSNPAQEYLVIEDGDFSCFETGSFDLVLACFPFDNISGTERRRSMMRDLGRLLKPGGIFVNIVSRPELYIHEWASFTTAQFEENRSAKSGDVVRVITTDFDGAPVCDDLLCDADAYRLLYAEAGLQVIDSYRPLGVAEDPVLWKSELTVAPWEIWILTRSA